MPQTSNELLAAARTIVAEALADDDVVAFPPSVTGRVAAEAPPASWSQLAGFRAACDRVSTSGRLRLAESCIGGSIVAAFIHATHLPVDFMARGFNLVNCPILGVDFTFQFDQGAFGDLLVVLP